MSGILYIVATPIGHLDDISPRALHILRTVQRIACEDTRHSLRLLQHYGIHTPCQSLHQHNERHSAEALLQRLHQGENIALISDAGTPLISDPGSILTRLAHQQGIRVCPIPGASSVMAALSASGLSADAFVFAGFIPSKDGERTRFLTAYQQEARSTVFFETPHRIEATLQCMEALYEGERLLLIARELSKEYEQIQQLKIKEALPWLRSNPYHQRGEFVLILEGAAASALPWQDWAQDLAAAGLHTKTISQLLAKHCGADKRAVYQFLVKDSI